MRRAIHHAFLTFAVFFAIASSASAHPGDVNSRYGLTPLPASVAHECNDCHVDPLSGGDCNTSGALDPWSPCLNAFGIDYRVGGWSASLGNGDSDGDGINNLDELNGAGSAGFPAGAEAGCNMLLCASNAPSPLACDGNVLCRATRITGPATRGASPPPENANAYHYSFAFTCAPGTASPPTNSDANWADNCFDVDECDANPCGPNADSSGPSGNGCFERPIGSWSSPGYDCACAAGYASDGTTCVVGTECTAGLDDCVSVATCTDPTTAMGDFICTCPAGYTGDGSASGSGCTDVDECGMDIDNCDDNALCTNTPGGFTCTCNGPEWVGDGVMCADYNECEDLVFSSTCDENAVCTNLSPGFDCACNEGFTGDGAMCTDIDECALGTDSCREDEECVNNVGPDNDCVCPPGFVRADPADPTSACQGMDAGVPDAGGMDAGGMDAGGMDAGGMDAGGMDAGGMDAGGMDAGSTDGSADSGPTGPSGGACRATPGSEPSPLMLLAILGTLVFVRRRP